MVRGMAVKEQLLVLDSLFDDVGVESNAAGERGATLSRWSGDADQLRAADAVLHVRTPVDAAMIAKLERCRAIGRFGSGLDTVDLQAAAAAGMRVVAVRNYCVRELTTHTLALAFALQRGLQRTNWRHVSWGDISAQAPLRRGDVAVVVGMGSVGQSVAAGLLALGYRVQAVTRTPELAEPLGLSTAALDDALPEADLLVLQTALDADTAGLIGAARLAAMKPGAVLVNTARLRLIDEDAVAAALSAGAVGGVGIDALLPKDSPLHRFNDDPRVIVTPHVGWYSEESATELRWRAVSETIDALRC
jgi:D-3-phosphoglycerate dehydrogenase